MSNLVVPLRIGQLLEIHYPNDETPAPGAPQLLRFDQAAFAVHGPAAVGQAVDEQAEHDLLSAEMVTFPLTLIVLLIVFGSALAVSRSITACSS